MLDLPKTWGNGQTVAADGTQFDFYDNNLTVGYHFRYRKLGAVASTPNGARVGVSCSTCRRITD